MASASSAQKKKARAPSRAAVPPVFDCVACGACCYNPDENRDAGYIDYIDIDPFDRIMRKPELVRRLVVLDPNLEPHMRLSRFQRCEALDGALGKRVGCTIYHDRPQSCRDFKAGSERCLQYRKERGVDR